MGPTREAYFLFFLMQCVASYFQVQGIRTNRAALSVVWNAHFYQDLSSVSKGCKNLQAFDASIMQNMNIVSLEVLQSGYTVFLTRILVEKIERTLGLDWIDRYSMVTVS